MEPLATPKAYSTRFFTFVFAFMAIFFGAPNEIIESILLRADARDILSCSAVRTIIFPRASFLDDSHPR